MSRVLMAIDAGQAGRYSGKSLNEIGLDGIAFQFEELGQEKICGLHTNRPHILTEVDKNVIIHHIRSFRGRISHYSRQKTRKLYLPEDLTITKMYTLFKEKYPNVKCSYEKYWDIFISKFNVFFGYP
ncbi:vitamin B12-dependent ribonucleotide reductase [Plakobranchus ocellatus]|uniref:Vitamin B12-dependent ribonucleotide reductase n=1 Tax=Plakobranchus ocellatus TaxID=259542 RepID=A0AAV4B4K3_9GAST|nr:vitamin B12-dependent ribonucleotide reductase [Plakobranchus ocellatus]